MSSRYDPATYSRTLAREDAEYRAQQQERSDEINSRAMWDQIERREREFIQDRDALVLQAWGDGP